MQKREGGRDRDRDRGRDRDRKRERRTEKSGHCSVPLRLCVCACLPVCVCVRACVRVSMCVQGSRDSLCWLVLRLLQLLLQAGSSLSGGSFLNTFL